MPKLRSVAQNEWKKHPYKFFLLLVEKKKSLSGKYQKKEKKFWDTEIIGNRRKIYMGVFSTHYVPLISILAPKIMEE